MPVPSPTPAPGDTPTPIKRDSYTTVSVIASEAATSASTSKSNSFPFAVAIPALVGGMALAIGAFWLWWWMSKRKKRQRRERWERHQRRKRNKANAQPRPSVSNSRTHSGQKSPINEKELAGVIPSLPKNAASDPYKENGYGYSPTSPTYAGGNGATYQQQGQGQGYTPQPQIDQSQAQYSYDQYGNAVPIAAYAGHHTRTGSSESTSPLTATVTSPTGYTASASAPEQTSQSPQAPPSKTGKRAAARMAVAETAAANASVDPAYRHRPNKPSPLALKAAAAAEAERKSSGFRLQPELAAQLAFEAEQEEMLAPEDAYKRASQGQGQYAYGAGARQVSGEWGVALGSPNNDGSFAHQQQNFSGIAEQSKSSYQEDPYLSSVRAVSGQYSVDPYAAYHGGAVNEKKGGGWL